MSSVWLAIPSKRPPEEAERVLRLWRERGYKIALWVDGPGPVFERHLAGVELHVQHPVYPGYASAVNRLVAMLIEQELDAEWIVTGGDDVLPAPNVSAEEIAAECHAHFSVIDMPVGKGSGTFGVMQPTGDRWGDKDGAYIDRVAGSPWIGREFARRMYQGNGPYWPEYTHMGVDEELQAVAIKYGVFWQRPDLIHLHQHWGRPHEGERIGRRDRMPRFLEKANSPEEWQRYKKLFAERKAAGFPGSEPL